MKNEKIPYKIYLNESEMPKAWYNLRADMKQKTGAIIKSWHTPTDESRRTGRCIL